MTTECNDHQEGIQPVWWLIPITVALRSLWKENPEFKAKVGICSQILSQNRQEYCRYCFIICHIPTTILSSQGSSFSVPQVQQVTSGAHCSPHISTSDQVTVVLLMTTLSPSKHCALTDAFENTSCFSFSEFKFISASIFRDISL